MTGLDRPVPVKTATTTPFWDALAEHRIVIQYSPSSGEYVFYPRVLAPRTLADDLEWREISGMGTLYSYTVARDPWGRILPMRCRSCWRSCNGMRDRAFRPRWSTWQRTIYVSECA